MTFICSNGAPASALRILSGLASCCFGAVEDGPGGCSCWEPVYNAEQVKPDPTAAIETRDSMCDDCAFRPDSPERQGDDRYQHSDPADLAALPHFWCHQGMRKPTAWRHTRLGIVVEADTDAYEPPIVRRVVDGVETGVPYKADGTPGDRCAGWAAHHRDQDPEPDRRRRPCHIDETCGADSPASTVGEIVEQAGRE